MTSDEKVINYKVVVLIDIYNFDIGRFAIRYRLNNLNFNLCKLRPYFWDLKLFQMKKIINYKVVDLTEI
jgi:hypothetical protein